MRNLFDALEGVKNLDNLVIEFKDNGETYCVGYDYHKGQYIVYKRSQERERLFVGERIGDMKKAARVLEKRAVSWRLVYRRK